MKKYFIKKIVFLLIISLSSSIKISAITTTIEIVSIDDEYIKFKKQGDEFFIQGEYKKALKKYLACLEVPTFSGDEYAKNQVKICEQAIQLNGDVDIAMDKKRNEKAINYLEEIYALNKTDIITKKKLKDLYANMGYEKMDNALYPEAIKVFKTSLIYGSDRQIDLLIRTCQEKMNIKNEKVKEPIIAQSQVLKPEIITPSKPQVILNNNLFERKNSPFLKIIVGVIGAGSGLYTSKINSDWNTKLSAVNTAKQSGDINAYELAYANAKQAKDSEGVRNLCVGIVLASVATEVYLFLRKPKTLVPKISFASTNNTIGLSLNYKL